MKNKLGLFLLVTVLLAALFGGIVGDKVSAVSSVDDPPEQLLKTFNEALVVIQSNYARNVESEEMVHSAIRGMLRTLDPHSSFFDNRDYGRLQEDQQGKYFGLGITIRQEAPGSGRVVIIEPPAPGTPAYKAGLRAGDTIVKVRNEKIDDWEMEEVIRNLKGPKGTKVNITIERPGALKPQELDVERDEISLHTIQSAFRIRTDIGYIKLNRFSETSYDELDRALEQIDEKTLSGLVLDLRDNPGGSLNQALRISERFLKKGQLIVSTRGRNGEGERFTAKRGARHEYPVVVLINRNSASASEIVAGAIQDHDRGLIVGETSFGKALVQTIYPMENSLGLALTTGRYYTPSNRLIQRDYSEGFYDYYFVRNNDKPQEVRQTDSGRKVLGGGGIKPDHEINNRELNRIEGLMLGQDAFFDYARKLVNGEVPAAAAFQLKARLLEAREESDRQKLMATVVIDDAIVEDFRQYLKGKGLSFTDKEMADNAEFIKRRIKEQVFISTFGAREAYKIAIEGDETVQKAIHLMPEAKVLLENSQKNSVASQGSNR